MRYAIRQLLLTVLLCGLLPLAGAASFGLPLGRYLQFPPEELYVNHPGFSPAVFAAGCLIIAAVLIWIAVRIASAPAGPNAIPPQLREISTGTPSSTGSGRLPWWGAAGAALCAVFWVIAWNRFDWAEAFQVQTFSALWFCYIAAVNGWCTARTATCPLLRSPARFIALFVLSAAFWWMFEYLNRFVQNWEYLLPRKFAALEYFKLATLSFSTVLPAVYSTAELLYSFPRLRGGFAAAFPLPLQSRVLGAAAIACASTALFLLPVLPNILFPLLWAAPLLVFVGADLLLQARPIFPEAGSGDWRRAACWCLAALICGFFWEMWNYHSLAKWVYHVPYVGAFKLFEMPLLGYSGYLPFGLECAAAAAILYPELRRPQSG